MNDNDHPHRKRSMFAGLRASFLTGLVVILPIVLTVWLIWTLTGWIDSWVLPFIPQAYQPHELLQNLLCDPLPAGASPQMIADQPFYCQESGLNLRGVGVIIFLIFTVLAGWTAKGLIGRSLIRWGENLVDRMPVVRSVYNGLKQIAETVLSQGEAKFDRACVVEYPRPGLRAIAFVSSPAKGEIARLGAEGDPLISVFLPTTPNPTSGFLLFVPRSQVTYLDMTVEDAAKLIISAGLVYPTPKELDAKDLTPSRPAG